MVIFLVIVSQEYKGTLEMKLIGKSYNGKMEEWRDGKVF